MILPSIREDAMMQCFNNYTIIKRTEEHVHVL